MSRKIINLQNSSSILKLIDRKNLRNKCSIESKAILMMFVYFVFPILNLYLISLLCEADEITRSLSIVSPNIIDVTSNGKKNKGSNTICTTETSVNFSIDDKMK